LLFFGGPKIEEPIGIGLQLEFQPLFKEVNPQRFVFPEKIPEECGFASTPGSKEKKA